MSDESAERPQPITQGDPLARLEERLARIERHLGLVPSEPAVRKAARPTSGSGEDELEFEVGQNWFAMAGTLALSVGAGFLLCLPFSSLPVGVPSLAGCAVVAALFTLARVWRDSFALIAGYLRGAGMALLFLAALRLLFPEGRHLLAASSPAGESLLTGVVALNGILALRRRSPWLFAVAFVTGAGAVLAVDSAGFVLPALIVLAALMAGAAHDRSWPALGLAALPLSYATYALWAVGNPLLGRPFGAVTQPAWAPAVPLALATILALPPLLRPGKEPEYGLPTIAAMANCALGYGLYLAHTLLAFSGELAAWHGLACAVFLGLAFAFWRRRESRAATFFYAMTGYAALSVAIVKASAAPAVFVWLSVQSVVVVATAIWFRSRFIVVANFLIYAGIVVGYALVVEHETGISLGFGVVALVSARILNWQQRRLELQSGLMRNAYLAVAFFVFPYALDHLVPARTVGFAWVGLALVYYGLNAAIRNQKYRWMGHGTLLLATLHVVVVGTRTLEPVYRVLSFLILGTVLLVVSLVFTRSRRRGGVPPAGRPDAQNR